MRAVTVGDGPYEENGEVMDKKMMAALRSQAQTMDPVVWIGRNGVTDAVVDQVSETLDSRELIKCAVQDGCPTDARETGEEVAGRVGAEIVQMIGKRFVLFRALPDDAKTGAKSAGGASRTRTNPGSRGSGRVGASRSPRR